MGPPHRAATVVLLGLASSAPAMADRIVVRNGPAIKGKAIIDENHPDQYLVFGERGKTPVILKRDRVARIEPEPGPLDEYAQRRKTLPRSIDGPESAQAEYDLGAWCEANKLPDLATVHYEASIRSDPAFAPGHRKLGHVLFGDRWLTPSEARIAQGYTLVKGRWITPEEKARLDAEASFTAEQRSWVRRLSILHQAILGGDGDRARGAEEQLLAIRDASAVGPIVRVFGSDSTPAVRKLCARALAGIAGPEASAALVARLLAEPDEEVRTATMAGLASSKEANVIPRLVQGLKSKSPAVVNRAAWALGNLSAVKAVPKLVASLVTSEIRTVWVPSATPGSPGSGFGVAGGGYIGGGQYLPVLNGPAVGPGAVAFGVSSVPIFGAGGGFGVNLNSSNQGPTPQLVEVTQRNVEVRSALMKITGQDFGYDLASWRRWLNTAYRPDPEPAKRVPQP